jgi:transcriptional regulator with XRE-family HTH domain
VYKIYEELLAKNNETSYQVAKATGISTVTLTEWKKGTYQPKVEKLMLIADHFNVPVTVFLDAKKEEVNN